MKIECDESIIDYDHYNEKRFVSLVYENGTLQLKIDTNVVYHIFDHMIITYISGNKCVLIKDDVAQSAISSLQYHIAAAIRGEVTLPRFMAAGTVGYFYNVDSYSACDAESEEVSDSINYHTVWLFSTAQGPQTFLYNKHGKIYLEIMKPYPWIYTDPPKDKPIQSFEEYIEQYTPVAIHVIPIEMAQQWLAIANNIRATMRNDNITGPCYPLYSLCDDMDVDE